MREFERLHWAVFREHLGALGVLLLVMAGAVMLLAIAVDSLAIGWLLR
jgi:hypothetical protein